MEVVGSPLVPRRKAESPLLDPETDDSEGEGLTLEDIAELDNITEASQRFLAVSNNCVFWCQQPFTT